MTMTAEKPAVGDEVYVAARTGGEGIVTRVGRKYLTVAYGPRGHEIDFDIATGHARRDHVGSQPRLMTREEGEILTRRRAASATLRAAGIDLRTGHSLTLEQVEALADLARSFDPDTSKENAR